MRIEFTKASEDGMRAEVSLRDGNQIILRVHADGSGYIMVKDKQATPLVDTSWSSNRG